VQNIELGYDTYGAGDDWRVGNHDDLVLATAIALSAERIRVGGS
jgi:alkanesulfonate monooxygenase SsuD/methylene tetrahydromethanopterin reductase-like flavin-dependent oxidoreductase (luciferase family)